MPMPQPSPALKLPDRMLRSCANALPSGCAGRGVDPQITNPKTTRTISAAIPIRMYRSFMVFFVLWGRLTNLTGSKDGKQYN